MHLEPVASTSKQASLPGTAVGTGVPRVVVSGGREGYVPWIWLMSAGLRGAARVRRVRRLECGGERECVCRLGGGVVSWGGGVEGGGFAWWGGALDVWGRGVGGG